MKNPDLGAPVPGKSEAEKGQSVLASTTIARLSRLVTDLEGPPPILLLGAGASVKSGIPPAADIGAMAAKWAYCRENGLAERDPRVQRSDWYPWLKLRDWYDSDLKPEDQYPAIVEHLLRPREERKRFFLQILRERVSPSGGYRSLAQLVANGWIRTILTTNFDDMIPQAFRGEAAIPTFEPFKTPSEADGISTDPVYPQVVFIHGAVEYYTDQNLERETLELQPELKGRLTPLLRDHPLIVIGYRGAERSVMVDLLVNSADAAMCYRHGIYWCSRHLEVNNLHPLVLDLAERIGDNFQSVSIDGFDEVLAEWNRVAGSTGRRPKPLSSPPSEAPLDLQPAGAATLADLDWDLVLDSVRDYASRLSIDVPASPDRGWLESRLEEANLIVSVNDALGPTMAGLLLFAKGDQVRVDVEYLGNRETLAGNVIRVLDQLMETLDALNEPFRLKGPTSSMVHPFPPAALKELVANALVHRDYSVDSPIRVIATDVSLRVVSPGGLVPDLDPQRLGERGVRSYRNPVVANFLFGVGTVDKAGSGLADVRKWSDLNHGGVTFGPARNNSVFVATLHARPERPDPVTRTADPSEGTDVFTSNLLPVRIEGTVHRAETEVDNIWDILNAHPREELPPFVLTRRGELITFTDLRDRTNPLFEHVTGVVSRHPAREMHGESDEERLLVQLLNRSLHRHARSIKLEVVPWDNRIYYPSDNDEPRKITYKARVRDATRTVAKPIRARASENIRFWEHQAMRFQFRRFGADWGLLLVPGWVFTTDGCRDILRGPRVGPLSTRRAARDYNPNVLSHLHFWAWTLCQGASEVTLPGGAVQLNGGFLSRQVAGSPPAGEEDDLVDQNVDFDDLSDELSELADEQRREHDDEA